jgi:hypothetical protein
MVVAMIAMRMVQMSIHQIVHVIAVGHSLVTTARTVDMPCRMAATLMLGRTALRILVVHLQEVLIDMVGMDMVQMAIVQEVDMAIMLDGGMTTAGLVLVVMMRMLLASAHGFLPTRLQQKQNSCGKKCSRKLGIGGFRPSGSSLCLQATVEDVPIILDTDYRSRREASPWTNLRLFPRRFPHADFSRPDRLSSINMSCPCPRP